MPDIFTAKDKTSHIKKESVSHQPKSPQPKVKALASLMENPEGAEGLAGHTHNPLAAFCYFPHNVGFINQEEDEHVILLVRRHILTNFPWVAVVVLMIFAPLVLQFFPLLDFLPLRFQTVGVLAWYLIAMVVFIQGFLSWFFSVNIVTNKRIVDVDFENLIYRKITDAKIEFIQDVTVRMGSVVRTLFNYGDVLIQTAAEVPEIEFQAVPNPDEIVKILSDLRIK